MGSAPEPEFDDLVRLAASLFAAPAAGLCFDDGQSQWLKAGCGDPPPDPASYASCCKTITEAGTPLWVAGPDGGAFVGVPCFLPNKPADHPPSGVIFVLGARALEPDPRRLGDLEALARQAMLLLEHRKQRLSLEDAERAICMTDAKRRLLEVTLRESEELYRSTFELAEVAIGHLDLRGKWIRVNDRYCELLGYDRDELMLLHVNQITHPDDVKRDLLALKETWVGRRDSYAVDKRYIRKDGKVVWVSLHTRLFRNDQGQPRYSIAIAQDISSRKEAEEKLIRSEEQLRWIFDTAPVGMTILGDDLRFLRTNESYRRALGFSTEELSGKTILDVTHPDDIEHSRQIIEQVRRDQVPVEQFEKRQIRKDGTVIWARITPKYSRNPVTGQPVWVSVVEDITDRKEAERKVAEHRTKLIAASKMSALGEMSGAIAHEINNPLTIIHGKSLQIQRLSGRLPPGEIPRTILDSARQIEATSLRISTIVKSLRSFSRDAENDAFVVTPARAIVDETLEFSRERLRNHGIELIIDPIPEGLDLECRPVQLSQVLLNLLNNAHDAVERLMERWIRVSIMDRGEELELAVSDSGQGIPSCVAEKLMQPFFTTKEIGKGTGLGLSVSKGIIESHDGSLGLDRSSPNTRFIARLPRRRNRV